MTNNLIPIDNTRSGLAAPSKMQARLSQNRGMTDNFSAGTSGGFHVLSIRAAKFHLRFGKDNERTITDPATGYAVGFLDVVLVNASKQLAKTYYKGAYAQGNNDQPDCWSMDSIRPDPSVLHKVNPTCQDCPKNAFGSRVTPDGKQAKACSDSRRVAIVFPAELVKPDPTGVLLRVPQSSLRTMRDYVDMLARNGYEPGGCVTRLSFDPSASFPKLMFHFVGPLTDQEFDTVEQMMDSPNTKAMLQGADLVNVSNLQSGPLTQLTRQTPITIDQPQGFAPGMLVEEEVEAPPVSRPIPAAVLSAEQQQAKPNLTQPVMVKLQTGEWLNTETGEVQAENQAPPPVIDPDVLVMKDGRFFHKTKQMLVENQFVGAMPWAGPAATTAPVPEVKKRAPRAAKAPPEVKEPEPQPQPVVPTGNGHGTVEKPTVVAASPKLEQLLSGLASKKDPK